MEALTVIRQARAAGLTLAVAGDGLRVAPRERLTPELRELLSEHKPEVLAVLAAANEAPNIEALLAVHGDGSAGGVDWSAWKLTTATSSPAWAVVNPQGLTLLLTVEPIPKPRSYALAWPVERIAPWPDVEDDLDEEFQERAAILEYDAGLGRAEAECEAALLIQRAKACWGCRNLRTATGSTDKRPRCDAGHVLVYRTTATRTWPGRLDAKHCGEGT